MYREKIKCCWFSLITVCLWMIYFSLDIDTSKRSYNGHKETSTRSSNGINITTLTPKTRKDYTKFVIVSIETIVRRYNTTMFLIEPSVLLSMINKTTQHKSLSELDVITFGVIGRYGETWETFCEQLTSSEFSTNRSTDIFHREVKSIKSVTTHIIIQHNLYIKPIIHIVIFYKKQQYFLWHSKLVLPGRRLTFAGKSGIYKYFSRVSHYVDGIHVFTPSPINMFIQGLKESKFIQCNVSRARQFYRKYPKYKVHQEGLSFQQEGIRIILIVSKVFNSLGIPFELCTGTLLGWYRTCNVLPYGDIDVEMFPADYNPGIIKALQNEGMKLRHIFGRINDSYELSFISPGGVRLDIFFIYEEDEISFFIPSISFDSGEKYKYIFPKFTPCWTTLQNILVRIPCNYDETVRSFYGDKWETPVRVWDYERDHKNIRNNGFWPKHEWKEVKQSF